MSIVRVTTATDFTVDYDTDRGMYRLVTAEIAGQPRIAYWFDAYEEKEIVSKDIAQPIKRIGDYYELTNRPWWSGRCPRCNQILRYDFDGYGKGFQQYCWKCGQLCDFEEDGACEQ